MLKYVAEIRNQFKLAITMTIIALLWLLSFTWHAPTISFLPGGGGQSAVLQDPVPEEDPPQ